MRPVSLGKIEVRSLVALECRAVRPTGILLQVGRGMVAVNQRDLVLRTLRHLLRSQREGCPRKWLERNLVGDLRQQQDKQANGRIHSDLLHNPQPRSSANATQAVRLDLRTACFYTFPE